MKESIMELERKIGYTFPAAIQKLLDGSQTELSLRDGTVFTLYAAEDVIERNEAYDVFLEEPEYIMVGQDGNLALFIKRGTGSTLYQNDLGALGALPIKIITSQSLVASTEDAILGTSEVDLLHTYGTVTCVRRPSNAVSFASQFKKNIARNKSLAEILNLSKDPPSVIADNIYVISYIAQLCDLYDQFKCFELHSSNGVQIALDKNYKFD